MAINRDTVEISAKNLRRAGIRTYLTLIGVIIGIAAIVTADFAQLPGVQFNIRALVAAK